MLIGALIIISTNAVASVKKNLSLNFSGVNATFNYSEAPWKNEFIGIDVYFCINTDSCSLNENRQKRTDSTGTISGVGLYLLKFYLPEEEFWGGKISKNIIYSQYITILPQVTSNISAIASTYLPKFSFHKDEGFFPISISDLFSRNYSDLDYVAFQDGYREVSSSDSLSELLSFNGSSENKLRLKSSIATTVNGNKNSFPVYWFHQISGNDLWITYFTLYAFDEKRNAYLSGGVGASLGSHTIDRESITIKFSLNDSSYIPQSVIYAGHLDKQPTTFLGCDTTTCTNKGTLSSNWLNGKTTVDWNNASRVGDSPVVYVAHGSHAATPAYGWYFIDTGVIGSKVTEPAGNSVSSSLSTGSLIAVDFSKPEFSPLTYSGYLIKGATEWYRIFPFVRFPIDQWASTSNKVFNDCVANKQGCEKYINQPVQATPSLSINLDQSTLTSLGAFGPGGYDYITGKDGRPAIKFYGVNNPGLLIIPNQSSMQFTDGATFDLWARIDSLTGMNGNGFTVTDGSFLATLFAKSHDRNGVGFVTNSTGAIGIATYDTTWSDATFVTPANGIPIGNWFRATYTISKTEGLKTYVNKVLYSTSPVLNPSFAKMNAQDLYIGAFSGYYKTSSGANWYPLNGAIQDIRIYQKALTASEIQSLQ